MALSLGRPVIFFCEEGGQFYRDVHPLTRLIHFETGVAVGAMVATTIDQVAELLSRTFENRMIYLLNRSRSGSLRLMEQLSKSVVRLQTSNTLLTETFWNHYHQDRDRRPAPTLHGGRPGIAQAGGPESSPAKTIQRELELEDTTRIERLAARSSSVASAVMEPTEVPRVPIRAVDSPANAEFPMSIVEVFDGISSLKSGQPTGGKRCAAFTSWLEAEGVGVLEGLRLLRFVEATLASHKARASYVYTGADLTRWYRQMSDGEVVGTMK